MSNWEHLKKDSIATTYVGSCALFASIQAPRDEHLSGEMPVPFPFTAFLPKCSNGAAPCREKQILASPGSILRSSVKKYIRILHCRFMVGTEQGTALLCNRKAKTPADRVGAVYTG